MTKEATLDELFGKAPATAEAFIVVKQDVAERWRAAQAKVDKLRYSNDESALRSAKEEVDALRPEVAEAERVIRFKALGNKTYEALRGMAQHQPTPKQRKDARDNGIGELSHNPETFPPALIAASSVAPKMSLDDATKLWESDNYSSGELALLFMTAQSVNNGSQVLSLGKESERTPS